MYLSLYYFISPKCKTIMSICNKIMFMWIFYIKYLGAPYDVLKSHGPSERLINKESDWTEDSFDCYAN